jgi:hypothetical protein
LLWEDPGKSRKAVGKSAINRSVNKYETTVSMFDNRKSGGQKEVCRNTDVGCRWSWTLMEHILQMCLHECQSSKISELKDTVRKWQHSCNFWLRHYATRLKVAGSKTDEVNNFFSHLPNPSGRTRPWGLLSL